MPADHMSDTELAAILARHGLHLSAEQRAALMPGIPIVQEMIARVNADLPREAELAVTFDVEQR